MPRTTIPVVVLVATFSLMVVVVVAAPTPTAALKEQPSSDGMRREAEVNQAMKWIWSPVHFPFVNPVAVGDGGKTSGGAVGGDATSTGNSTGGGAIVGGTANDFDRLFNNVFGEDFWASLRSQLKDGALAAGNSSVTGSAGGNVSIGGSAAAGGRAVGGSAIGGSAAAGGRAVGGSAIGGSAAAGGRAVGGSAVVVAGQGGLAVGGSASVVGNVDGKLQVLKHSTGETSDVIGRIAAGGVATL